jgi:parvulin-like peptidyl-prolyl isomerase
VPESQGISHPVSAARGVLLLAFGAATGVALAAAGLAGPRRPPRLPADAVARVNGTVIRTEEYQRVVAGLVADRRDGIDAADRRRVVDRLIDEELLVQRGLELGLARNDRKIRSDLTAAVIASIVAQREDVQPSDAELEAFYESHRDFFAQPGRLRVRRIFCRVSAPADDAAAQARAQEASRRLRAGEAFGTVQTALGDPEIAPLPDVMLPPAKLLDYLGPTALRTVLTLEDGAVSEPVRAAGGYHVMQVVARQTDGERPLAEIRAEVLAEFHREDGERALRDYLDELRGRADVVIARARDE